LSNLVVDTHTDVISVPETEIVNDLMKLENDHNWRIKTMQISVLYVRGNETSMQQIFQNQPPNDSKYWKVLDCLGTRMNMKTWPHNKFRGDLDRDTDQPSYFTEWRGREVMFHVAPWLNVEQHRRLTGNDIVHIIFFDNETEVFNANIIQMGTVPHIFSVIRPHGSKYNFGFFYRDTIFPYKPSPPPRNLDFDMDDNFRDYLLTRLHNGVCVTKLVPPMNKLFIRPKEQFIYEIGEKWSHHHHIENQTNNTTQTNTNNNTPSKLLIRCVSGHDLIAKDSNGLSDPFVVVKLSDIKHKTSVIEKTLNPVWNETIELDLEGINVNSEILITVYDKDPLSVDYMGNIVVLVKDAIDLKGQTKDYTLLTHKTGKKVSGYIKLSYDSK